MSLDRTKLQKVRDLANGGLQAQCPACAETGQDRTGEHLRMSPDGKFGCCVHPGDRKHRSRIFALAGEHGHKPIKVRVAAAKRAAAVQLDLGRLGRLFSTPAESQDSTSITIGTLGTPLYSLCEEEKLLYINRSKEIGVPSVPEVPAQPGPGNEVRPPTTGQPAQQPETGEGSSHTPKKVALPYLTAAGDLRIPFDSPERYHWWKPPFEQRLRVKEIIAEIRQRKELDASPF